MVKKMRLMISSIFKNQQQPPWQYWPSCKHPKTLSFRATADQEEIFEYGIKTPESWFTNSSECASFSTEYSDECVAGESLETVVRGVLQSERLFFEPGCTSSILEEAKTDGFPFKESVVLAMESEDPYEDFRRSMEEMVQSHDLKDWDCLEELLRWYLKVNGKKNHGFIVGAFVDLLVGLASPTSCSDESTSFSSAVSSLSSSFSPPHEIDE